MFLKNSFLVVYFLTFTNSLPTSISTDAEIGTESSQGPLIAKDKFLEIDSENEVEEDQIEGELFFRDGLQIK